MRRLLLALVVTGALTVRLTTAVLATERGGWDHVGHGATSGVSAFNGSVYALNADDPGILYVGGAFTDASGLANADHLAKWNGGSWSAVNGAVTSERGCPRHRHQGRQGLRRRRLHERRR